MRKRKRAQPQRATTVPILTEWDKTFMAYHEAGHAVCSYFLPERERLICATIDPTSEAFGMIKNADRPHHNETEASLIGSIAVSLAGRFAEELFLLRKTTSCIHDLESAISIAEAMVLKFGMGRRCGLKGRSASEEMIRADVNDIITTAEAIAKDILTKHRKEIIDFALLLRKNGTLNENSILKFFEERK